MELKDVMEKRASIRMFTDEKIPIEDVKEMIRRAGLAPSINNSQPWKFITIINEEIIEQMGKIVQQKVLEYFPHDNIKEKMMAQAKVLRFSSFFIFSRICINSTNSRPDILTSSGKVNISNISFNFLSSERSVCNFRR